MTVGIKNNCYHKKNKPFIKAQNILKTTYIGKITSTTLAEPFSKKIAFHNISNFKWINMRCCGDWLFWALMVIQGDVIEIYERFNLFRRHSSSTIATSIPNGINYEESALVINEIEKIIPSIDKYRCHVNHGKIYKQIKRQKITSSRKKELLELIESLFGNIILSFIIERINKFLSIIICSLHFSKADRCSPQE